MKPHTHLASATLNAPLTMDALPPPPPHKTRKLLSPVPSCALLALVLAGACATTARSFGDNDPLLVSPSTSELSQLHRFACAANSTPRATRAELVAHYSGPERLRALAASFDAPRECRREMTAWRYKYIDECDQILVREKSIDERAANVLYTTRAAKSLSVDFFTYNWGNQEVDLANMHRVAGPRVDDDRCARELRQMLDLIRDLSRRVGAIRDDQRGLSRTDQENKTTSDEMAQSLEPHEANTSTILTDSHLSLAKILDSFGRYDSGLLFGKLFSPGSYHQCIWNKLIVSRAERLNMRFCWAHLSTWKHLDAALRDRQKTRFETPAEVLMSGICIPESCHSKSFNKSRREFQELVDGQFELPPSVFVEQHLKVDSIYCLVDEGSQFTIPLMGRLLLGFLVCWCLLILLASSYNRWPGRAGDGKHPGGARPASKGESLLANLDLGNSWRDFMNDYTDKGRVRDVQLDTMNVVKVFGCAFVVLGHTMALYLGHSMDEVRLSKYIEGEPVITLILAGTMVVDTFFVITGILWSYLMMKRLNRTVGNDDYDGDEAGGVEPPEGAASAPQAADLTVELNNCNKLAPMCDNIRGQQPQVAHLGESAKGPLVETAIPMIQISGRAHLSQAKLRPQRRAEISWRDFRLKWLMYSTNRYLKIVPLYVMVHWFKKYVFIYAGTGPFWDHGLNRLTMSGTCHHETPLTPLTFLAAYYPLSRQCIFQSWSVANDIFFALLAPPTILLMNIRPRLAAYLSVTSCLVILALAQYSLARVPPAVDEEIRELRSFGFYRFFDEVSHFYTAPHYRIFCFLAGVWAGYSVYVYQLDLVRRRARNRKSHQAATAGGTPSPPGDKPARIEWPGWVRGPGTWVSFAYILAIPIMFAYNQEMKRYMDPLYRITYHQFLSTMRVAWALANSLILLRMMTDWKDTALMRLSASKFWQIFAKLNYAILLIHLDMVNYTIGTSPSLPGSFTKWGFFNLGAGVYLACIPLSILVHVVFENPINRLIRSWLPAR